MSSARKRTGIILGVLALIIVVVALLAPKLLDLNRYHGLIVAELEKAVGGQVQLGNVSWGVTHELWLEVDEFAIVNASAFSGDVKLTRLYAEVSIPRLLRKIVTVKDLRLESSEVRYRLEPGANEAGTPTAGSEYAGINLPVEIEIEQLAVVIKRLEIDDAVSLPGQTLTHKLSDVDLSASGVAPEHTIAFDISLRDEAAQGLGALKANGTFTGLTKILTLENPDLKMNARLDAFHVDAIKPYLDDGPIKNQLDGSVSMKVSYASDLGENLHAQGSIDLGQLAWSDPSLWDTAMPGRDTSVTFEVTLDPQDFTAEKISIKLGTNSIDGHGVLRGWSKEPVIKGAELSADLSLTGMVPFMPWKQLGDSADLIRSILQGGGKITVDKVVFPDISLVNPPATINDLLPEIEMTAEFIGLSVEPIPNALKIEDIAGRLSLQANELVAENIHGRIGPIGLPVLSVRATDLTDQVKVKLNAKGPLKLAADDDEAVDKLLLQYGLRSLEVEADIDINANFDQRTPEDWTASGTVSFNDVRAQTHPEKVTLDSLTGEIAFNRKKNFNVSTESISARVNNVPVQLSGKVLDIGSSQMLIAVRGKANNVNLAHLAELLPALKEMKLEGILDLDVDVHMPWSAPAKSRLEGIVKARDAGFLLASSDLAVAKGNLDLELSGNSARIKTMTVQVNDQEFSLSGKMSNPPEPNINLVVTSPDLNLERLLPPESIAKSSSAPSADKVNQGTDPTAADTQTGKAELPPAILKLTADLKVQADRGQYKGVRFDKLTVDLGYRRGVIERYKVNFGVDKGHVGIKGSADLRDPDRIRFKVEPNISALSLDAIAPALGIDALPITGPLTLTGQLSGRMGSSQEILGSLNGDLAASLGPGNVNKVGKVGDLFVKLSSMAHISSLFSGRLLKDLSDRGMPFEVISAQNSFDKGTLDITRLHFASDAMTVDGHATIDLANQKINMDALLVPLATVDEGLNLVPLVGKALQDVTRIRIDITGPLNDPTIRTAEIKEIGKEIEDVLKKPFRVPGG